MATTSSTLSAAPADAARPEQSSIGLEEIEARVPEFSELAPTALASMGGSLDNLLDVTCNVTAELGRARLSIGEVLKLNAGSIVELDRLVSQPVDVLVQGVLLARGEVVVVNDRFAIRIQEILDTRKSKP